MQTLNLKKEYKKYPIYKDSGVEWIGKIPKDWNNEKFKFIATYQKGKNPEDLLLDQKDDTVPYLSMEYLRGSLENISYASPIERVLADDVDTILLWDGSNAGEFIKSKKGIVSSTSSVVKFNKKLDKKFGYYFSKSFEKFLRDQTNGMGIPHVDGALVVNSHYVFPLKDGQDKIVNYLEEKTAIIDQIIEKKLNLIELLREKRTAVINNAVTKGLDPKVDLVESGIDWIGKIPKGWEVKKLKFLGEAIIGLTYSPEEIVSENGILVLRSSNVQHDLITLDDNVFVNKIIPKRLVTKVGDILICSRNGSRSLIGKNAVIDENSAGLSFGAFMTVFRTKYSRFISCFLKSNLFMSQLSTTLTSTINQLTTHYLNNIVTVVPPTEEQKKIVTYLDKKVAGYEKTIGQVEKSIELLNEFKSSLISNVVMGKVKV